MVIQKAELAGKLNKIKGVVPKKSPIAALQGVLVSDGFMTANDLEIAVRAKLEDAEGESFIIPERAFDLINNLPDGEMEISASAKDMITIKADKVVNRYQTMDPDDFPPAVPPEDGEELTIRAEKLMESMKRVAYAVSPVNTNTLLTAMCLQASGGQLSLVGSDNHMLAWDRLDYEGEFELLIPKNAAERMKTLGLSGDMRIKHGRTGAMFVTEEFEVFTRLLDGKYFDYRKAFSDFPMHTVISRADFLDAMVRAKMCTEARSPVIFKLDGGTLDLDIRDQTTEYHETLELQEDMEGPLTIGFNAQLVLETLKSFDCDNVGISFGGPKSPMIIEAEDSDFRALVLPVFIPAPIK